METTPLHVQILSVPIAPQYASPLLSTLPPEVRSLIFSFALTDYPDPSPENRYDVSTCYTRPSYFAPRKSDTALLRSCRAVYAECWFLPFVLKEQIHWLTDQSRAPPEYQVWGIEENLRSQLKQIAAQLGEDPVKIAGLRVFAQMYILQRGELARLLSVPFLGPRKLTLTIRHADWWYWETDAPLRFEAVWIKDVCKAMPSTVREVCIELESLERKKDQVDSIAKQMGERWFFKTRDGVVLHADATGRTNEVSRWRGTSTWHGNTWVRDETEPGLIDYYVVSVTFLPEKVLERRGGKVSDEARRYVAEGDHLRHFRISLHVPPTQGGGEDRDDSEDSEDIEDSEDSDDSGDNEGSEAD